MKINFYSILIFLLLFLLKISCSSEYKQKNDVELNRLLSKAGSTFDLRAKLKSFLDPKKTIKEKYQLFDTIQPNFPSLSVEKKFLKRILGPLVQEYIPLIDDFKTQFTGWGNFTFLPHDVLQKISFSKSSSFHFFEITLKIDGSVSFHSNVTMKFFEQKKGIVPCERPFKPSEPIEYIFAKSWKECAIFFENGKQIDIFIEFDGNNTLEIIFYEIFQQIRDLLNSSTKPYDFFFSHKRGPIFFIDGEKKDYYSRTWRENVLVKNIHTFFENEIEETRDEIAKFF